MACGGDSTRGPAPRQQAPKTFWQVPDSRLNTAPAALRAALVHRKKSVIFTATRCAP